MMLGCFASDDGSAAQTVTLVQKVNQAPAAPIVWQTPEAIPFGTPLSTLQLNATSATVGAFVYQPAIGSMLPSGTNTLSVVLSPSDQNYAAESASVSILVVPPGSSSFTISPPNGNSPDHPLVLQPGVPATIQIAIGPVGEFHQPVTLSCSASFLDRSCLFSSSVVRPTTSPIQVSLTLTPGHDAAAGQPPGKSTRVNAFPSKELLPSVMSSALFGMLFLRRRLRGLMVWPAMANGLLALPLLALLSGCGSGYHIVAERIEIRGSSLVETHLAQIYVVNQAFAPWDDHGTRLEGGK